MGSQTSRLFLLHQVDGHTKSQQRAAGEPPPSAIAPLLWLGFLAAHCNSISRSRARPRGLKWSQIKRERERETVGGLMRVTLMEKERKRENEASEESDGHRINKLMMGHLKSH